ncbi:MAG: hypothetical protein M1817_000110 [Caeruleum heppii]|nr:MAG: hypothetical protein M1817_000110 [Caeruleum heppii]
MTEAAVSNGTQPPQTPKLNGLSLTEYSTNPSPPSRDTGARARALIPESYLLPNGFPDYLRLILTSRVYEVLDETPLTHALNLSNRLECKVLLKREDLLPVFSFKLRGAYNKMAHLNSSQRWKGVVACSAGNHAQGVAYAARKLKIPATIVMPEGTPSIKHLNVSRMGGSVVLNGADFDSAKEEAHRLEKLHGLTNIAPFDDPYVIAGQGTIGMELCRQTNLAELEAIFCCVGGGGLIAGIGVYIKRICPHVKVIGVETYDANAMVQSLKQGHRVVLKDVGLFADGAAVKTVGEETFRLCQEVVDEVIQVTTDETCAAIKDVFEDTRSIVEPAGALALAGLKKYAATHPSPNPSRALVAIASGANMNFDRLRFVAERAALGEKKEALLALQIPEQPGAFAELIKTILPHPVTEFSYRYSNPEWGNVLMGISLLGPASRRDEELSELLRRLNTAPTNESSISSSSSSSAVPSNTPTRSSTTLSSSSFVDSTSPRIPMSALDITTDELSKTHLRHLAGGRSSVPHEYIYTFSFPERPGMLARFLTTLTPAGLNISLFHYRNVGGDVGRVLVGIQIPDDEMTDRGEVNGEGEGEGVGKAVDGEAAGGEDRRAGGGRERRGKKKEVEGWLDVLGFPWREESENEVWRRFLRG